MNNKSILLRILPVLFSFFIMGFVDVVGISTSYVRQDFSLSNSLANLLPMMAFLWFAIFSVPTGILMNKAGRKNTVLFSMVITFVAMIVPFIVYNFPVILVAFGLLGIGNTILQVSLNPLLTNVVREDRLTSSLTLGQFIKAVASFLGPLIAAVAASKFGNWKFIFPSFGILTLLAGLWLWLVPIKENDINEKSSSFRQCFSLLNDPVILLLFIGILTVVGLDVGLNTATPKLLMDRTNLVLEKAGLGTSVYFAARTTGTLLGAILLLRFSARKFFVASTIVGVATMTVLLAINGLWAILGLIFILGFSLANVFSIIFSFALQRKPEKANEISGLMIMGVAGGAIIPPLMGVFSDVAGSSGAMTVLLIALLYLLFLAFRLKTGNV